MTASAPPARMSPESINENVMNTSERELMAREMQMQQVAIGIYELSQKAGISLTDLMIVFGGMLKKQADESAKEIGKPSSEVQKMLLNAFAIGLSGVTTESGSVQ